MRYERRKYKRFAATAFLNTPVQLKPLQPYFGHHVKGRLIDLSAGGLAMVINEIIPQGTTLHLSVRFPDGTTVESVVRVSRVLPKGRKYLLGIEFLNLAENMVARIDQMSSDYINCESRIAENAPNPCLDGCSFYNMCSKPQRKDPAVQENIALELEFKTIPHV